MGRVWKSLTELPAISQFIQSIVNTETYPRMLPAANSKQNSI